MRKFTFFMLSGLLIASMILTSGVTPVLAVNRLQVDTETPTDIVSTETATEIPTATSTNTDLPVSTIAPSETSQRIPIRPSKTPKPTITPTPTITPIPTTAEVPTDIDTARALILATYSLPGKGVVPGHDFKLVLELYNQGSESAYNVIVTIQGDKLIPRDNGGVQAVSEIAGGGGNKTIQQILYATPDLAGQETVSITINVAYDDKSGATYTTPLVILVNLKNPEATVEYTGPIAPTKTGTDTPHSKLIISSYKPDIEKLQAGNLFKLKLNIQNQGNAIAKDVTMVLGGATVTNSGEGTPASGGGGVSGGGADLSKFAPMGSSNLYSLGDMPPSAVKEQSLDLVVNVGTEPGVYPLKISLVYQNAQGENLVDDQVITLLVYALPQVTVSFYDTVGDIGVGEFRPLPVQITNTGKKATILGEVTISTSNGTLSKNTATIGTVDTGGYFTMDPEYIPDTPGPVTLTIQIKYTDDFQQSGLIEKTLSLNVVDSGFISPDGGTDGGIDGGTDGGGDKGGGEVPPPAEQGDVWHSILQALLGFFGLAGG